ncbi:2'-5' RNA ligase family protein [Abyssalbus ytuae]|uniref:Mutarotase n=1 Tax=Abyssalbus ytuae TaxID=2926907 RepID=A0A9E6ZYQ5_9FLAO|nr:mutarotase [Abyssalbus ytuae]UOB17647.1 mutarotase [Abyssalbus ytuae]
MDLPEEINIHYENLWQESIEKFRHHKFEFDPLIDSEKDMRRGITLLARPDKEIKRNIASFINEFKSIDPHQYFYPVSDIHITIMSVISCYEGFKMNTIDISKYIEIINKSIKGLNSEQITFNGLTASSSCIMLKGFPLQNNLNKIRNNLRENFKKSNLESSIDHRYKIKTAHSTIIRFKEVVKHPDQLIGFLEKNKDVPFGSFKIKSLELVYNDWYQKAGITKLLHTFKF